MKEREKFQARYMADKERMWVIKYHDKVNNHNNQNLKDLKSKTEILEGITGSACCQHYY